MDTIIVKFIIFQLCIWIPIGAGSYLAQHTAYNVQQLSSRLVTINLVSLESFIVLWTTWGAELSVHYIVLPFAGIVMVIMGFAAGAAVSFLLGFNAIQKHTVIISSSLANHGFTMGGFLCYLILGEHGLALSFIFITYFMPYVILVIFSYARYVGTKQPFSLRNYIMAPQNMPLFAIIVAIILHVLDIKRPVIAIPLDILLGISIIIYYFSMGIYFKFTHIKNYCLLHLLIAIIKFCFIPLCMYILLSQFPLPDDIQSVIRLQSCMPAAIYSVITSILFHLDKEMATSIFVVNTVAFSIIVLPALIIIF